MAITAPVEDSEDSTPDETPSDTRLMPPPMSKRNSDIGPTPPPKDTPLNEKGQPQSEEYFPPPVPLKSKKLEDIDTNVQPETAQRPDLVPTLSTTSTPLDDENDRLRKEIVRSLSPTVPSSLEAQQSLNDIPVPPIPEEPPASAGMPRESMYLPSEYDNYWAETAEEEEAKPVVAQPQQTVEEVEQETPKAEDDSLTKSELELVPPPAINEEAVLLEEIETPPIPPLSAKRTSISRASDGSIQGLPHRFSWEASAPEQVNAEPTKITSPVEAAMHQTTHETPTKETPALQSPDNNDDIRMSPKLIRQHSASPAPLSIRSNRTQESPGKPEAFTDESYIAEVAAAGAAAIAGVAGAAAVVVGSSESPMGEAERAQEEESVGDGHDHIDHSKFLASDKELPSPGMKPVNPPEYTPTSPAVSHGDIEKSVPAIDTTSVHLPPAGAETHLSPQDMPSASPPPALSAASTFQVQNQQPLPQQPLPQALRATVPPPRQFREIASLSTAEARIRAYNESRRQYAAMDSGLAEWVGVTSGIKSGANTTSGPGTGSGQEAATPISAKDHKSQPSGAYYQHYLAANMQQQGTQPGTPAQGSPGQGFGQGPSAPGSAYGTPSPYATPGSAQGRTSTGLTSSFGTGSGRGKEAAKQFEAKGKEFLHSAGIFGGKASKAGKGLLAKGRNKLKGAGGEKVE
jgi:hypothetical protein